LSPAPAMTSLILTTKLLRSQSAVSKKIHISSVITQIKILLMEYQKLE